MENNFDRLIRQKLENLDVEYNPSDWDRMEEKIVEQSELNPAIEDVYLDGMIYDTLSDTNIPYDPAHWEIMKARLEDPYAIRRRLMKYKVLEVALVALLLITIGRIIPFEKARTPESNTAPTTTEFKAKAEPIATLETQKTQSTDMLSRANAAEEVEETTTAPGSALVSSDVTSGNVDGNAAGDVSSHEVFRAGTTNESLKNALENTISTSEENPTSLTETKVKLSVDTPTSAEPERAAVTSMESFEPTRAMDALSLKNAGLFALPQVDEMEGSRVLTALPKTINVRIGMVLGPDANYVMTPSNRSKDLDVFNQYALGYSGGFTLGFNYGRWEIETAALYSAVSYDSRNIYEIKGSFADGGYVQQGLEGAQLDIVRIPLNLKFNFTDHGKWNVYAFTGASANATLETFYKITTTDLGLSDASRNFAGRTPSPPDIEPQKAQENFDGIFEGGSLSKNLFYTANLGFGLERYFTPRMSVFLQPNFQYHFSKGLGPQTDRMNSVSLLAGAKVTLKKRKKQ